jgi:CBS domain-containing protein
MRLRDILEQKSHEVRTITSRATLEDVVAELVRFNIGSLIVRDVPGGQVLGIITERDILRALGGNSSPMSQLPVAQSMTRVLISARPDDDIMEAMRLMTTHRVRHLPVIEGGELHGLLSIGDVVKAQHDELVAENHHMRSYIQGGSSSSVVPL